MVMLFPVNCGSAFNLTLVGIIACIAISNDVVGDRQRTLQDDRRLSVKIRGAFYSFASFRREGWTIGEARIMRVSEVVNEVQVFEIPLAPGADPQMQFEINTFAQR
jgi:hypothetical protein